MKIKNNKKKRYEVRELKFISYDGEYPNLCGGRLVMKLDGKKIIFPRFCLCSGGDVSIDEDGNEIIEQGEWFIDKFPKDFPKDLEDTATNLVNENIEQGCCGGCI